MLQCGLHGLALLLALVTQSFHSNALLLFVGLAGGVHLANRVVSPQLRLGKTLFISVSCLELLVINRIVTSERLACKLEEDIGSLFR